MLPSSAGKYLARPQEWSVGTSKGGAVQFAVKWQVTASWNGAGWNEIDPGQDVTVTSYSYLFNKSGEFMEMSHDAVRDVFGWDGASLETLNDGDWSGVSAELTLDWETWEGKDRLKVKWFNRPGSGDGGLRKLDAGSLAQLQARFGSTLRAHSGAGSSAAKPAAAVPAAAPKPAPSPAELQRRKAWTAFVAFAKSSGVTAKADIDELWKQAVASCFPVKGQPPLSETDWKWFEQVKFSPPTGIGNEPLSTEEEIPR